uniref:Protein kinase domain-containing protein n=1 Tax=Kalanchoe fedtschenkoi TaxID=63787 RepID=A0A7N1A552_KALFE
MSVVIPGEIPANSNQPSCLPGELARHFLIVFVVSCHHLPRLIIIFFFFFFILHYHFSPLPQQPQPAAAATTSSNRLLVPRHMATAAAALLLCLLSCCCFPSPASSLSEADALLKLKQSFTQAQALDSWNDNTSPCTRGTQWRGVICMNGIVTGIHLTSMSIAGPIDVDALTSVRGLRTISLSNNSFSGPIPPLNRLGALKALYLSSNQFSGDIPPDFFSDMNSLKRIWLSGNGFSGAIPDSLGKLSHLRELHLENNKFSGRIPDFPHNALASVDFSDNELEGEIPESLSRFKADSFRGNPGLCGEVLNKECPPPSPPQKNSDAPPLPPPHKSKMSTGAIAAVVLLIMISLVVFATIMNRRRDDDFDVLAKDDAVEVHVAAASTARRGSGSYSRRSSGSSRRGSAKNVMGDLVMVNEELPGFGLADLMKASAEVLGNGGLGSAYKAVMANGISVVVKRMREMNRLGRDGFDGEMKRIGSLHHPNILTPLAYHYRKEEKLLVSEYVPKGSLLYVLHGDRGSSHTELTWPTRLKIVRGIARGLDYLHTEFASVDLPHGNLKSSNVLLDGDCEPQLSDYAFYPLINTTQASQALFALKSPEYIQYQQVHPKSDIYCLGIIILEIVTGKFPSQYLNNGKGGTDIVHWVHSAIADHREVELIDPEVAESASETDLDDMQKLLHIGATCTETVPDDRPSIREVIRMAEDIQV